MATQHRHALPSGFQLDGYRIERVLGTGGFAITYLAREVAIDRAVAIKEFLPSWLAGREAGTSSVQPLSEDNRPDFEFGLAKFRDEARTLIAFEHPNIIAIHRFFETNGTAYLVMQYVEGEDLDAIVKRDDTLPQHEIEEILHPLLDGLEAVHAAGFLHRDIKPGNIFVRADGRPVLIDFGAARLALGVHSRSLTSIVTRGYTAFEQYETRGNQGPWTDIYAMGAVLYRCATGAKPPEATDRVRKDRMRPLAQAAGAAGADGPGYDAGFARAVEAALRVDETKRPQSVAAWRAMFRAPGRRRRTISARWQMRAAAIGIGIAFLAGGYLGWTEYRDLERERAAAVAARKTAEAAREKAELARRKADEARKRADAERRKKAGTERRKAEAERKRKAEAERRRRSAAASRPLTGAAARALLAGRTAFFVRRNRLNNGIARVWVRFETGGTAGWTCRYAPDWDRTLRRPCRRVPPPGRWAFAGDRLCLTFRQQTCFRVFRKAAGYLLAPAPPRPAFLAGPFTLQR